MSFTGILALLLMVLFGVSLYFVIRGIKTKNIKMALVSILLFCGIAFLFYYGLVSFITRM